MAPAFIASGPATSKPKALASRLVMPKTRATLSASVICCGVTPSASAARMSSGVQGFVNMRNVARSGSLMGAVSRSARTACTVAGSPYAWLDVAECAATQNEHWLA